MTKNDERHNNRTPLFAMHRQLGGKLVDFSGWEMPLHYGSQIDEHHAVRQEAGMFDVSHMTVIDVCGHDALAYLRWLLANDVARIKAPGKALYSPMLNETGGVVDDLIVYWLDTGMYRLVVNCATREKDLNWMTRQAEGFDVSLMPRTNLCIIAVQGPKAIARVQQVIGEKDHDTEDAVRIEELETFSCVLIDDTMYARTGYTGEDGLEIILPAETAQDLWEKLLDAGVTPCGLGARDTLRLEAGLNLYGAEMDEDVMPMEANLSWCTALEPENRKFCGRDAIEKKNSTPGSRLVGLQLKERGILRGGQTVYLGDGSQGAVTSGSYSPTLKSSIALARIPAGVPVHDAMVRIRGRDFPVSIGVPRFVRKGKAIFKTID